MNPNYMEIAEIAQYERPAWGVPGTHVSGIINMHILVRKKPRVRASGPLRDPGRRARATHPNPRVATATDDRYRPTEAQSRPTQRSI
jgi:hypothetical protein